MLNVSLDDLYSMDGLKKLDLLFLEDVKKYSDSLLERTLHARNTKVGSTEIMLELAFVLEKFITKLFGVEEEVRQHEIMHEQFSSLYKCKRNFVHRYALRKYSNPEDLNIDEITSSLANFMNMPVDESTFANQVNEWMQNPEQYESEIDISAKYAAYMTYADNESVLFQVPEKYDVENLVPTENTQLSCSINAKIIQPKLEKIRMGFNVATQPSENYALNEVHYCIVCHKQNRDSCSKGMQDKSGNFKMSPLGVLMTGCPLKVKISEVNFLRSQGLVISPLAIVVIDNPMCALTGHRICNDCSRACIYQKQQQVDIPSIETHILDSVLSLSYGFEIYSLFTRWNPLAFANVLPQTPTNKNVLVVGLGPAGIGLSHYLLNEGHNVVAIDGLKIDPLPENLSGVTKCGKKQRFSLIKDVKTELFEHLDYRTSYGFGGVAEYGITARWNKNYLKVARLLLERRDNFSMYGGVTLGSTLSVADALSFGFHHVALATGAGAPRIPDIKNVLAKGVLTASSFLMSLHLGNAPHTDSVTNLQIRLPCVVIGGGLTAVDTATELLAYYPVQVEKFLSRYEEVTEKCGKSMEDAWDVEEHKIFSEFISHAQQIREEKKRAEEENRIPNVLGLLKQWNGVTIVYRGSVVKAIASAKNGHLEISKTLSEHKQCEDSAKFFETIRKLFHSSVVSVVPIADCTAEITIHSPLASKKFNPGQFYRIQNFKTGEQQFEMECVAVTGASVSKEDGTVTVVVSSIGGSSKICTDLRDGQLVSLMGPTGSPTYIPHKENVMLVGGGVGNAVLFSIGEAMINEGCNVLYFAGYKTPEKVFGISSVERSSSIAVFCCETGCIEPRREQDRFHNGNVISAITEYGKLGSGAITLDSIDRIIVVGSSGMMSALSSHVRSNMKHSFKKDVIITASINSPMQCMMKKICGQCIQKHRDPITGEENFVYSCVNQDQCARSVDFNFLQDRLKQNSVLEKCTSLWINSM